MDTQNTSRQLRYLEEVRIPLHVFDTLQPACCENSLFVVY